MESKCPPISAVEPRNHGKNFKFLKVFTTNSRFDGGYWGAFEIFIITMVLLSQQNWDHFHSFLLAAPAYSIRTELCKYDYPHMS